MATLTELRKLFDNPELKEKLAAQTAIAAYEIGVAQPPEKAIDRNWARETLMNTAPVVDAMMKCFLSANKALSENDILNASDLLIQTTVDGAVDALVGV